jgi:hypothetical protein
MDREKSDALSQPKRFSSVRPETAMKREPAVKSELTRASRSLCEDIHARVATSFLRDFIQHDQDQDVTVDSGTRRG